MFEFVFLPPVVGGLMSYLRYLCLFVYSGVKHKMYCVLCFVYVCLVYPMLPVSMDCPLLVFGIL
jgi:hypothetical protein